MFSLIPKITHPNSCSQAWSSNHPVYMNMCHASSNTWKWSSKGFTLDHDSSGVTFFTATVVLLFRTYKVQFAASSHKVLGIFFSESIKQTKFTIVRFFTSTTPSYYGVQALLRFSLMPLCLQTWNSCEWNSSRQRVDTLYTYLSTSQQDSWNILYD